MTIRQTRRQSRLLDHQVAEVLGNGAVTAPGSLRHQYRVEQAIQLGQPSFPHAAHLALTVATAGAWLVVYVPAWLLSAQRRYQRARRRQLQAAGLA